nr:unnamed protein product [Callosobruchus chinensis]
MPLFRSLVQKIAPIEPKRSQKKSDAIDSSIKRLLQAGILSLVNPCKDGPTRSALHLKSFNELVKTFHFKLETHKTVPQVITPNCYMSNIDLKDAYCLLLTVWVILCSSDIHKNLISQLRKRNLLFVIYLDDFLLLGKHLKNVLSIRGKISAYWNS